VFVFLALDSTVLSSRNILEEIPPARRSRGRLVGMTRYHFDIGTLVGPSGRLFRPLWNIRRDRSVENGV